MVLLAGADTEGKIVHEVQPYQALIMIANAYHVKVNKILALNGLQADWPLQIGQRLLIDPGNVTPSPTPRPLSAIEKITPDSVGNYYHTVKNGEYLAWIADVYEITLPELLAWNGLTADSIIQPGQKLLLRVTPPAATTPSPTLPGSTATMTQSPLTPTSTREPTTPSPSATAAAAAEAQSSFPGLGLPMVIVLLVTGLLVLVWYWRRRE